MKRQILVIVVVREMTASAHHGFDTNTEVRIYRGEAGKNFTGTEHDTVLDFAHRGTISNASVIRAKRAQLVLAERASERHSQPQNVPVQARLVPISVDERAEEPDATAAA